MVASDFQYWEKGVAFSGASDDEGNQWAGVCGLLCMGFQCIFGRSGGYQSGGAVHLYPISTRAAAK